MKPSQLIGGGLLLVSAFYAEAELMHTYHEPLNNLVRTVAESRLPESIDIGLSRAHIEPFARAYDGLVSLTNAVGGNGIHKWLD